MASPTHTRKQKMSFALGTRVRIVGNLQRVGTVVASAEECRVEFDDGGEETYAAQELECDVPRPRPGQCIMVRGFLVSTNVAPGGVAIVRTPCRGDRVMFKGRVGTITRVTPDLSVDVDGEIADVTRCRLLETDEKAYLRAKVLELFSPDELRALAETRE